MYNTEHSRVTGLYQFELVICSFPPAADGTNKKCGYWWSTTPFTSRVILFEGRLAYNEEWDETAELLLDAKLESNEF